MSSIIITPENVHQIATNANKLKGIAHVPQNQDLIIHNEVALADANRRKGNNNQLPAQITKSKKKRRQVEISTFGGLIKKQPEEEIKLEWTSPDYERVEMFGGLYRSEKGERKTIIIRGKKGFCESVVQQLSSNGNILFLEQ